MAWKRLCRITNESTETKKLLLKFKQRVALAVELSIYIYNRIGCFLAHLSRRLVGELIVYPCSGVRPSVVRPSSTISNMNISATSGPITMKFYQKHHWDGGKAALGFGPDRIQTLVSMATNSSHRVIMEKTVLPLFLSSSSSEPFYTCR